MRALHALACAIDLEALPDDKPTPFEEFEADLRVSLSFSKRRRWVAWADDGSALGSAALRMHLMDNLHLGDVWVMVHPEKRRRGIGSSLLQEVVEAAKAEGRTSLMFNAREGLPGFDFLEALGLEEKLRDHHNRMLIAPLDVGMLEDWVERAKERASGYSLHVWEDDTPEEWVEPFAVAQGIMNTAPRDDLDFEDEVTTPEMIKEWEAEWKRSGLTWWNVCAVEEATGVIAGFTTLYFSKWRDDIAFQGNTGVDPAHRNKGLGRWVKATNLLKLIEERPSIEKVDTWNAGSNDAMLGINHALGFTAIEQWGNFQGDTEQIAKALAARS